MNEVDALLILNAVEGLGNARIKKLISYYGSALKILSLKESSLKADQIIPASVVENLIHFEQDKFLKNEYNLKEKFGVDIIVWQGSNYPNSLSRIPDAPIVLYSKGDISILDNFCIGIVGSRRASVYGLTSAEKISYELSEKGVAVISGLARGIDTAAHKGALKAKGKTVAVLGSGLGNVYPKENKGLFQDIYCSGLVLSEFSIEASPVPYNFPRRNRIISGLSSAIVVVEAAQKSGALITADFALEQGRDVYAVPGPIDRMNSCGVNHLIQQGAKLVAHIDDILEDWNNINLNHRVKEETISNNLSQENDLSDQEKEVFKYIDKEPVHIDALAIKMDQEVSLIHRVLLQLELKRVIAQLPGKNFKRISKG